MSISIIKRDWGGNMGRLAASFGLAVMLATGLGAPASQAQDVQGIAALVNDKVISTYDLEQRVRLVVATSGLNPTDDALERVREQVLRTLVDEEVQLQEAAKVDLKVPPEEVSMSIARLAQRSGMNRKQILKVLADAGVTENTLRRQLEASIAWDQLTQGRFGSSISVSEEDVNQTLEQMKANADKPQYWMLEIFLGVDSPDEEDSVRDAANRFVDQMRKGEASFPAIARQFSESASASAGGDIGWMTADVLPKKVAEAVEKMRVGSLSVPIRDVGGYYLVAVRDKRIGAGASPDQITLTTKQIVIPALPDFPEQYVRMAANMAVQVAQANVTCENAEEISRQAQTARYADLGTRKVSEMSDQFQQAVAGLTKGDVTQPVRSNVGFHVLVVCDQKIEGDGLPDRELIENRLFSQQLSMVQRRYLRDLRRDATVDMRVGEEASKDN